MAPSRAHPRACEGWVGRGPPASAPDRVQAVMFVLRAADDLRARSATPRHGSADPARRTLLWVRPAVPGGIRAPTLPAERPVIADATMTALHAALTGLQQRS